MRWDMNITDRDRGDGEKTRHISLMLMGFCIAWCENMVFGKLPEEGEKSVDTSSRAVYIARLHCCGA